MKSLLNRLFGWRYVMLTYYGESRVVRVEKTEAGWVASFTGFMKFGYVILGLNGRTSDPQVTWRPYVGWEGTPLTRAAKEAADK